MKGMSLILTMSLASILTVALFSAIPNDASAQQVDFDYRCYNSGTTVPIDPDITLIDQFFPSGFQHQIGPSVEFCNPAVKTPEAIEGGQPLDDLPHLRCWTLTPGPSVEQEVIIKDQFFPAGVQHTVKTAVEFCHTTFKDPGSLAHGGGGNYFAGGSDLVANWKCYAIDGDAPPQPLRILADQFTGATGGTGAGGTNTNFPTGIEIGEPVLLCTPATKDYMGNIFSPPIEAPALNEHMKCYDIIKEGTVTFDINNPPPQVVSLTAVTPFTGVTGGATGVVVETIMLTDQFSGATGPPTPEHLTQLDKICADAEKLPIIAGTFIPIESVAILLAGAQMSAAWILPALVAVTGIGYGIEIARKYQKDTK